MLRRGKLRERGGGKLLDGTFLVRVPRRPPKVANRPREIPRRPTLRATPSSRTAAVGGDGSRRREAGGQLSGIDWRAPCRERGRPRKSDVRRKRKENCSKAS